MTTMYKNIYSMITLLVLMLLASQIQADTLYVYGPGGPAPAMKELAAEFAKENNIKVEVSAGPASRWMKQAKRNAHVIYSGSANMTQAFVNALEGRVDTATIEPLYIRPSTILVRPGNPKNIKGVYDLTKPGVKILVTEGAGQVGMWEDVIGRTQDIGLLKAFRNNIAEFTPNSGVARKVWINNTEIDAWLIWNHWEIDNPGLAMQVPVEDELTIWRPTEIALTEKGKKKAMAQAFVDYVKSAKGEAVFSQHGWQR